MRESYYAGLDVGLKSTFICVVNAQGEQLQACEVASDIESIAKTLNDLNVSYKLVGLETGQLSIYLSKGFA